MASVALRRDYSESQRDRPGPKKKTRMAAASTRPPTVTPTCAASIGVASPARLHAAVRERRRRRLLRSTDTLENDMAAAAYIGFSSHPVNG
jgi:hypothetical protein